MPILKTSTCPTLPSASSPDAGFDAADLTSFRRLDELGLVLTGQRLEPAKSGDGLQEVAEQLGVSVADASDDSGAVGDNAGDRRGQGTADAFAELAMRQMLAGGFFIVSHADDIVRIRPCYEEIDGAYSKYAPRYPGDDEFDVQTLAGKSARAGEQP